MIKKLVKLNLLLLMLIAICSVQVESLDWSRWKGPDQNGISKESNWDPQTFNKALKINWQLELGVGYANVATQGNKVFTIGYDKKKKKNELLCLDSATGKTIWKYAYKATKGSYAGPKCTPVIDQDRVYTLSQDGLLLCNQVKSGKLIWKRQVVKDFGAKVLRFRLASSVLIEGELAIINANQAGLAVDKMNGKLIWKSAAGQGNYSTPVSFKIDDELMVAVYGQEQLNVVQALTGKVKWTYPWKTTYDIIAADPYIYNEKIFISSGYGNGGTLIDFSSGQPKEVWRNKKLSVHFSTVIIMDGYIYGIHGDAGSDGKLKCVDMKDGKVKWSQELGFGNMVSANGYLIFLNEQGSLFVIKADPKAYQLVSSKENVIKGTCWTAPILSNGNLYVRNNKGHLISIDVSK